MREIKRLFDPEGLLNPGVILNDDPNAHLKNLKPLPPCDPLVDKCIECGFCEPKCPSRGLTLSPRQRIVGWREIARLDARRRGRARAAALHALYDYHGIDTCAACGLCATACPVGIETGLLIKALRGASRRAARAARRRLPSPVTTGRSPRGVRAGLARRRPAARPRRHADDAALRSTACATSRADACRSGRRRSRAGRDLRAASATVRARRRAHRLLPELRGAQHGRAARRRRTEALPVVAERLFRQGGLRRRLSGRARRTCAAASRSRARASSRPPIASRRSSRPRCARPATTGAGRSCSTPVPARTG